MSYDLDDWQQTAHEHRHVVGYDRWPGERNEHTDASACHPKLLDDPADPAVYGDTPYADYDQWPDNERWLGGRPPRQP